MKYRIIATKRFEKDDKLVLILTNTGSQSDVF